MTSREIDHWAIDDYLNAVLNAFKTGTIDIVEARSDLAHAIVAVAIDNKAFKHYIRRSVQRRWEDAHTAAAVDTSSE